MKELSKSIRVDLPPLRLYVEDIREIEEVYKKSFNNYKIIVENFEIDSSEELSLIKEKTGKDELNRLSFESMDPYIRLDLSPSGGSIFSLTDDNICRGVIDKLKEIVLRRASSLRYIFNTWFLAGLAVLVGFLSATLARKGNTVWIISIITLYGFCAMWATWVYKFKFRKYCVIFLRSRGSQKNFFARNKDQILLSIISAFFGSIMTLIVLWFFKITP